MFTLFAIADSSFSVLFLPPIQVSPRQAFILKQKLLAKWIPLLFNIPKIMSLLSINGNCLIPHLFFNNLFTSLPYLFNLSSLITKPETKTWFLLILIEAAKFNVFSAISSDVLLSLNDFSETHVKLLNCLPHWWIVLSLPYFL